MSYTYGDTTEFTIGHTDAQVTHLSILNHKQQYLKRASPDDENETKRNDIYDTSGLDKKKRRSITEEIIIPKNPALIDRGIQVYRESMSKLKITYLEQETRHKFLDAILQDPPLYVEQPKIAEIDNENIVLKSNLREKKRVLHELLNFSVSKAVLIQKEYSNIETKLQEMEDMNEKVKDMEDRHTRVYERLAKFTDEERLLLKTPLNELQQKLIETRKRIEKRNHDIDILTAKYDSLKQSSQVIAQKAITKQREKVDAELMTQRVVMTHDKAAKLGLEEKEQVGKWYRTAIPLFQDILGIKDLKIKEDRLGNNEVISFSSGFHAGKHLQTKTNSENTSRIDFKLTIDSISNLIISSKVETSSDLPDVTEAGLIEIQESTNNSDNNNTERVANFIIKVKHFLRTKLGQ